ncbi:MAG: FAD-binding oxidoreductase [Bacteroidetes bacterium]|nr:FAD-binding oxidoreductase [Bacteroidota bacterium]
MKTLPNLSFWEQQWLKNADILIIGSGIVGLQTARHIKNQWPHREVWVIDRAPMSLGASTRNAGFACFGSMGEILDDISRTDENTAYALYEKRYKGLQQLLADFGETAIGYEKTGGYEIFTPEDHAEYETIAANMNRVNNTLESVAGEKPFQLKSTSKLGMKVLENGVYTPLEGMVQTHLLYKKVQEAATSAGVRIMGGLSALPPEKLDSGKWRVKTQEGYTLDAQTLVVCTNGYAAQLLPQLEVVPARGQVLVTSAIPGLAWRGLMHADKGYIYFRSLGTRILIGGGRNLDFAGETTPELDTTEVHQNRTPIVQRMDEGLYVCVRMGGMGVALSALVSRELAQLVKETR